MTNPSMAKTQVETQKLLEFTRSRIDSTVTEVIPLKGGETAQAYEIVSPEGAKILRISSQKNNFLKDCLAGEEFSSDKLKIPRVLPPGDYAEEGKFYAVSEKVPGNRFCDLTAAEKEIALPSMMSALVAVHALPLPEEAGFGRWEYDVIPQFQSWREFLLSHNSPVGKTYGEHELIDKATRIMDSGSALSLQIPYMLHGDFGNDNLLVVDGEVSGVIDWGESKYGDPVYDIAWLEFWDSSIHGLDAYEQSGGDMDMLGKNLNERMLANKCSAGLGALRHYQQSCQAEAESWMFEHMNNLLKDL